MKQVKDFITTGDGQFKTVITLLVFYLLTGQLSPELVGMEPPKKIIIPDTIEYRIVHSTIDSINNEVLIVVPIRTDPK